MTQTIQLMVSRVVSLTEGSSEPVDCPCPPDPVDFELVFEPVDAALGVLAAVVAGSGVADSTLAVAEALTDEVDGADDAGPSVGADSVDGKEEETSAAVTEGVGSVVDGGTD